MFQLRDFQQETENKVFQAWQQPCNVLAVLPTGSGKTVLFSDIIDKMNMVSVAVAHRQELIGQMSLTFAKYGMRHRIIGPTNLVKTINQLHVYALGKSYYDPGAQLAVAGINTLVRRKEQLKRWLPTVKLWVLDEAHHLLQNNIWGKGIGMVDAPYGLGVTATPKRADGQGLGRHADGLFDQMITGPTGRFLIERGYLCDYVIYAPPCNIDLTEQDISKTTGDYSKPKLVDATRKSTVMGDIVNEYCRRAYGKLGVSFLPSIELAQEVTDRFNASSVPARLVTANTPDVERVKIMKDFKERRVWQLVNVDLFGEGTDIPALEVVSMGRKTESFSLFSQQFGRALRIMDGKEKAIIIDHVGNVVRHASKVGLPDTFQAWTLDRVDRKKAPRDPDMIPLRACDSCSRVYQSVLKACPYCGAGWVPTGRATPEQVEGDLEELDPLVLAALSGEIARIDTPDSVIKDSLKRAGNPPVVAFSAAKKHRERQEMQQTLRANIAQWAGYHKVAARPDGEIHKRFWLRFGVDIMTAQTLGIREAENLNNKIIGAMGL